MFLLHDMKVGTVPAPGGLWKNCLFSSFSGPYNEIWGTGSVVRSHSVPVQTQQWIGPCFWLVSWIISRWKVDPPLPFVSDSVHKFHGRDVWVQPTDGVRFGGVTTSSLLFADDVLEGVPVVVPSSP